MSIKSLFHSECEFITGAASVEALPNPHFPEVVFAGRSNVGKSSLLNALTHRNSLARTSKTPGCTQQVNFFLLAGKLMLVDVPGYGYAKGSKKEVKGWNRLVHDYLTGRPNLKRIFLLIDARHGIKPNDREIMKILDIAAVSYQVVLTKVDKVKPHEVEKLLAGMEALAVEHTALHPETLRTSSATGEGLDAVRSQIAAVC